MNGFAELIANRRRELDLGIDQVAAAVDRSVAVLEAWENDRTFPEDPAIVTPLSRILDLPSALLSEALAQSSPNASRPVDEAAPAVGEAFVADSPLTESPTAGEAASSSGDKADVVPLPTAGAIDVEEVPVGPTAQTVGADGAEMVDDDESGRSSSETRPLYQPSPPGPALSPPEPVLPLPEGGSGAPEGDLLAKGLALVSEAYESLARRFRRRRWASRAPTSLPSYVEDRKQRTTYQLRAIFTGVAIIVLILFIRWSWGQFADAFGSLWQTLVDAV